MNDSARAEEEGGTRVFFAVWPDPRARVALGDEAQATARATRGRATTIDRLHLTLAFIGNASPVQVALLESVGSALAHQATPFMLTLDCIGMFRNAKIAWMGAADIPIELARIVTQLRESLLAHSLPAERRDFKAHVTLARHCRQLQPARKVPAIRWQVQAITLTASRPPLGRPKEGVLSLGGNARSVKGAHNCSSRGPQYRTLAQWSLTE